MYVLSGSNLSRTAPGVRMRRPTVIFSLAFTGLQHQLFVPVKWERSKTNRTLRLSGTNARKLECG